jgi:hypothetical protein
MLIADPIVYGDDDIVIGSPIGICICIGIDIDIDFGAFSTMLAGTSLDCLVVPAMGAALALASPLEFI